MDYRQTKRLGAVKSCSIFLSGSTPGISSAFRNSQKAAGPFVIWFVRKVRSEFILALRASINKKKPKNKFSRRTRPVGRKNWNPPQCLRLFFVDCLIVPLFDCLNCFFV